LFTRSIEQILANEPGTFSVGVTVLDRPFRYVYNPVPFRSASMIKTFMLVEAFRQAEAGTLDFAAPISLTAADKTGGAGVLCEMPDGTPVPISQLAELMITESDNTATNIMINLLGMANINRMIQQLSCPHTSLQRKMMDWESPKLGRDNWTDVRDCNLLWERLYQGRCLTPASDAAMIAILKRQTDRDKLPRFLPSTIELAHKTGELEGVEHDGGIVFARHPYAITILSEHLPDGEHGKRVVAKLSRAIYDQLQLLLD